MNFNGKTIWITGASSGIGEALAKRFVREGSKLILSSRRENVLEAVRQACITAGADAGDVKILPLDVTDEANMKPAVQKAQAFFGRIDLLINNAGISQRSRAVDTSMQTYRKLFDIDVFGQIALTKAVIPVMLEQGEGHLAVTASVAGKIGAPERTGYCAAKHAMMGFFDGLRAELNSSNIGVTTITPGFIRTAISENALKGDGSVFGQMDDNIKGGMDVDDCADVIVRSMKKGKREIPVGKGIEMLGLKIKRFFPNMLFNIINKIAARQEAGEKVG